MKEVTKSCEDPAQEDSGRGTSKCKALRQARLAFPKLSKGPKWLGECVEGRTLSAIGALAAWLMQVEEFALHSDMMGGQGGFRKQRSVVYVRAAAEGRLGAGSAGRWR